MLTTNYLGLTLKNPLIAGSSGWTATPERIKQLEQAGIGAVVLKSIFEEDIFSDYEKESSLSNRSEEEMDTLDIKIKQQHLEKYAQLIQDAKKHVSIPVIASINCTTSYEWSYFASEIQKAGADALEMNIYEIPEKEETGNEIEKRQLEMVNQVINILDIPLSVKLSKYHTSPANFCHTLSQNGVSGITLFNRFLAPDFDPFTFEFSDRNLYSSPDEYYETLRWMALLNNKVKSDLCASTGIHNSHTMLKMLAAGASAVQVVSAIYKHGASVISKLLEQAQVEFRAHKISSLQEYQAKAHKNISALNFRRAQFLKLRKASQ
ncbi:MAG: dihydroorotate dehydrogenase-like protein [Bacteroidales bacterium]|nr:dihydroorotate dehydrogenase-like protein [Bacteroidales bacterium]